MSGDLQGGRRIQPTKEAMRWVSCDPPDFEIKYFPVRGRGIITTVKRFCGDFLLNYCGELISAEEGERREEECSSGFRFFFNSKGKSLCVDATEETERLGRLVNHGRKDSNAVMKEVNGNLSLFCRRDIEIGDEILYDYGLKKLPWEQKSVKKKTMGKVMDWGNQDIMDDAQEFGSNKAHQSITVYDTTIDSLPSLVRVTDDILVSSQTGQHILADNTAVPDRSSQSTVADCMPLYSQSGQIRIVKDSNKLSNQSGQTGATDDITVTNQSDQTDEATVSSQSDQTDDTTVSNQSDITDDITVSNQSDQTDDITVSNQSDQTGDTTVSNQSDQTDDITVSIQSDQTDDATVSNQSDMTDDNTVSNQSDQTDDITVSNQSHQTDDTTVSNQSGQTDDTTVFNQSDQTDDTTVSNQSDMTDDITVYNQSDMTDDIKVSNQSDQTDDTTVSNQSDQTNDITVTNQSDQTDDITVSNQSDMTDDTTVSNQSDMTDDITVFSQSDMTDDTTVSNQSAQTDDTTVSNQSDQTDDITISNQSDQTDDITISNQSDQTDDITVSNQSDQTDDITVSNQSDQTDDTTISKKSDQTRVTDYTTVAIQSDQTRVTDGITVTIQSGQTRMTNITTVSNQSDMTDDTTVSNQSDMTDITVSNQSDQTYGTTVSNQSDQTDDITVSNQSDMTDDTTVSNQSDMTDDITVSSQSDQTYDTTVSNQSDQTDDTTVSNQSDQTDDITVSNQSDQTDDTTISKQSDQTDDITVSNQSDQTDDTTISKQSDQTDDTTVAIQSDQSRVTNDITVTNQSDQTRATNDNTPSNQSDQTDDITVSNQSDQTDNTTVSNQFDMTDDTAVSNQSDQTDDTTVSNQSDQTDDTTVSNQSDQTDDITVSNQSDQTDGTAVSNQSDQTDDTTVSNQSDQTDDITVSNQLDMTDDIAVSNQSDQTDDTIVSNQSSQPRVTDDITVLNQSTQPRLAVDTTFSNQSDQFKAADDLSRAADDKTSHYLEDCFWGFVAVIKRGEEVATFPMKSTVMAIGSASSNDIIVKTARPHEALLEVNHFGQVYLIGKDGFGTCRVRHLKDEEMFEVGGRAFRWKYAVQNEEHIIEGSEPALQKPQLVHQSEGESFSVHVPEPKIEQLGVPSTENELELEVPSIADSGPVLESPFTAHKLVGFVPDSTSDESVVIPAVENIYTSAAEQQSLEACQNLAEQECGGLQRDGVMTVNKRYERKGKHDYSKLHACVYCDKLDLKISRHLCRQHRDEKEIAQLPEPCKKKSEAQMKREHVLDALRNEGDFLHNIEVLKGSKEKELIVSRRPGEGSHTREDYLPCKYCLRFYVKGELWRHGQRCKFCPDPLYDIPGEKVLTIEQEDREQRKMVSAGFLLLRGAGVRSPKETISERNEFYEYVIDSLQDDVIGKGARNDIGIVKFGQTEFERLGRRRAGEVRYRMRLLERVKIALKPICFNNGTYLADYLSPDKFDKVVEAVRIVVGVSEERSLNGVVMFTKPELAKKTGQLIRKFADIVEGSLVVSRERERRQDVADFLFLYSKQWSGKVGSIAHQTSVERQFNKQKMLPLTEDLVKLQCFLDDQIKEYRKILSEVQNKENWVAFAKLLLTKITMFNFRRGNECSGMLVRKFQERADWRMGNQEIYNTLSRFECQLAKRMDLVEVIGKQNRKVPVLLTVATKTGIELLITMRKICGIDSRNPYVFAKGKITFIEGCEALKYVLKRTPNLEQPETLNFPTLRKYLATVVQVFGMNETDLQEVARHMGHELAVHRKFYRLQDDVIELAKISKLLLAVENGKAAKYSGMGLDDLDLNDFADTEVANEMDTENEPGVDLLDGTRDGEDKIDKQVGGNEQQDRGTLGATGSCSFQGLKLNKVQKVTCDTTVTEVLESPVRLTRKRAACYLFEEEPDQDPDYIQPADNDSDSSDSSVCRKVAKKQRRGSEKRVWTEEEKTLLKPLVATSVKACKPPVKEAVKLVQRGTILAKLDWIKVKHQVWAMTQSIMKKDKKIMKDLTL